MGKILDGFISGLLGRYRFKEERKTPKEIIEKEQDRFYAQNIRNQFEEQQEVGSLQDFLQRQPYYQVTLARPSVFKDFIGQGNIKEILQCSITACKLKKTPFPHTLFWSEAGLGKTTLSYLIAKELQANLVKTSGGQLENRDELMNIFRQFNTNHKNILFIDEIHAIKRKIAEMLYSAMEDFRFDYTTKTNKVLSLNLPPFTLIGATTNMAKILVPIRQRFQHKFKLEPYTTDEICEIIYRYLSRLDYQSVKPEIVLAIAERARDTARYAINYTKNILQYRLAKGKIVTVELVKEFFNKKGIDKEGLTEYDKEYLHFLDEVERAGINTLTKALGIDKKTVEDEIEPYLLRKRLIRIATTGRELTRNGVEYVRYNQ